MVALSPFPSLIKTVLNFFLYLYCVLKRQTGKEIQKVNPCVRILASFGLIHSLQREKEWGKIYGKENI